MRSDNYPHQWGVCRRPVISAEEKPGNHIPLLFQRLHTTGNRGNVQTLPKDDRVSNPKDVKTPAKELKEKAAALQSELSKTLEATANAEKFMKVVRKYTSFEELTPTLLREFVEKIVIHESEALDGKRRWKLHRQEIKIYYSFAGKVELPG